MTPSQPEPLLTDAQVQRYTHDAFHGNEVQSLAREVQESRRQRAVHLAAVRLADRCVAWDDNDLMCRSSYQELLDAYRAARAARQERDAKLVELLRRVNIYLLDYCEHENDCRHIQGGAPSTECCVYGRVYAAIRAQIGSP